MMPFLSSLADATGHGRLGRTYIHSDHGCIEQVADRARRYPNIQRRTVPVLLRTLAVPAKCERHGANLVYARS
jgi:hypothetical protein